MSECGAQCALSIILVGFVWGATNPILRAAAKVPEGKEEEDTGGIRIVRMVSKFLRSFLDWRFSVPFALNQAGSILFNVLVVNLPVTVVVPCVNAVQFIATMLVGHLMGEKMENTSSRQMIGMVLATVAIIGMLVVD